MREIAQFVAVLACSLFAGAAVYINLVEHPARMQCGVELAATELLVGVSHSVHAHCDLAHQQAIAESDTG